MNNPIIVVPTYWKKGSLINADSIYDHPTDLLSPEETLTRTLHSFSIIEGDFDVLVIGVPTRHEIGKELDDKVETLIKELNLPYNTFYFGFEEYIKLKNNLTSFYPSEFSNLVSNAGYGNIRNLCILIPHLLGKNISILIDDDEIITEPSFVRIATEFIGKKSESRILGLVLGFYRNEDGSVFLDDTKAPWWELVWNKPKIMNKAFQIIEGKNRLVDTPFAFGGNMVIHRTCWTKVPFDPLMTRGEDMDYLRNVKYFGFDAQLDRSLSIIHKPPKSQTSYIEKFKQDIFRFLYAKGKLEKLGIEASLYDPYPGTFLKQTEGNVLLTELLYFIFHNRSDLITVKNPQELNKKLHTIPSIFKEASSYAKANSVFYIEFQKKWGEFMNIISPEMNFNLVKMI